MSKLAKSVKKIVAIGAVCTQIVGVPIIGKSLENQVILKKEVTNSVAPYMKQEGGTKYYVDNENGNDQNEGTTPEQAWKTLDKVNETIFQPGDQILLKADGIWNGQLWPKGSGQEGNPIILDKYGEGEKPIINGGGTTGSKYSGTVQLYNQEYWVIRNLEVTNYEKNIAETTSRSGIAIITMLYDQYTDSIIVEDCYVHDVNAHPSNKDKMNGGITLISSGLNGEVDREYQGQLPGFNDVIIRNNHIEDVAIEGIRNGGPGYHKNVQFENNYIEEVFGDGIVFNNITEGGAARYNVVKNHCNYKVNRNYAGLWLMQCTDLVLEYNEVFGGKYGYVDGEAYDVDMRCHNTLYQYNYSHHNNGGFCLFMHGSTNSMFRYNISANDGNGENQAIFHLANNSAPTFKAYNNTIYVGPESNTMLFNGNGAGGVINFQNNIVHAAHGKMDQFSSAPINPASIIKNNCFYPESIVEKNGPSAEQLRDGNIFEDPKLSSPHKAKEHLKNYFTTNLTKEDFRERVSIFKLQENSPCIDGGKVVEGSIEPLIYDLFGNRIVGNPDIGAHEFSGDPGPVDDTVEVIQKIEISKGKVYLEEGEALQLESKVLPVEALDKTVKWRSSNETVATVSATGKIIAHKAGEADILVYATLNPMINAICKVIITEPKEVRVFPVQDATVTDGKWADTNYGSTGDLVIKRDAAGYRRKSYIQFEIDKEIKDKEKVYLNLYIVNCDPSSSKGNIDFYTVNKPWVESEMTWRNAPGREDSTPAFSYEVGTEKIQNEWIKIDITEYVSGLVATSVNLEMDTEMNKRWISFKSKEGGSNTPYISIEKEEQVKINMPEQVKSGDILTVDVELGKIKEKIYAEDFLINYDKEVLEFIGTEEIKPTIVVDEVLEEGRVLAASIDGITEEKQIMRLKFRAKEVKEPNECFVQIGAQLGSVKDNIGKMIACDSNLAKAIVVPRGNEVDKTQLSELIRRAEKLSQEANVGTEVGQYPAEAKEKLDYEIQKAQEVLAQEVTQEEIDGASENLRRAIEAFEQAQIKYQKEDVNQDNKVDVADIALGAYYYKVTSIDLELWKEAQRVDMNDNNEIEIQDLAIIAGKIFEISK